MKKIIFTLLLFSSANIVLAQDYKTDLEELKKTYEATSLKLESVKQDFEQFKSKINHNTDQETFDKIKDKAAQIKTLKESKNITLDNANAFLKVLEIKKINLDENKDLKDLVDFFKGKKPETYENTKEEKPKEPKVMFYFGEDKVLSEQDSIFNDKTLNDVFKDILNSESKTYLGDFIIPQDGQKIMLYKDKEKRFLKKLESEITGNEVLFKSVKIHAKHGLIQDIKIKVLDENGNTLLFENNVPITLLRYSRVAAHIDMLYRHTMSNNINKVIDTNYVNSKIKLADVLMYINNPGENYVPDELQLEYPTIKDGKKDNAESSVVYEIRKDNSLENVLNLRTYTDFLSLFGDSPNGLIQVEGKADFYIAPFNFRNSHNYIFKKISPYINYARIEENERNINTIGDSITNNLDILQKSYLNMGLDLDVFSSKFRKEFPFDMTLYATARYNVANVRELDSTNVDFSSLSLGGGLRIDVKRFNNFGLTIKSEMTKLDTNEFNNYSFLNNLGDFWVFRNEAEIFYHPKEKENQSIFLRLSTFNNAASGNNEAFFQLQFGYRFSVGLNKVKAK